MAKELENDEIEIDLQELIFTLLAHWKMIVLSTVLVAAIALTYTKLCITPLYESTSQLYVLSKSTSITSLADIQTGTSLTNDYMVVVGGRTVLDQVIENLGLEENYAQLKGKVTLNNPTNSRVLEITVTDPDVTRAKKIADEIATVSADYIAEKMNQDAPSVIQTGYVDGSKVSPNTLKNTAIGAAIGFLLAAMIVVITYLLNDTIMSTEDVEKKLGLHVLGTLPLDETEYDGNKSSKRKQKSA